MATPDQLKTQLRRYFEEIVHKGNLAAIPDFVAADIVFTGPYTAHAIHGLTGFSELIATFHSAFADLQITEDAMLAEGDTVAIRWTTTGVHKGSLWGPDPRVSRFSLRAWAFIGLQTIRS